jgi:hypothetical protein
MAYAFGESLFSHLPTFVTKLFTNTVNTDFVELSEINSIEANDVTQSVFCEAITNDEDVSSDEAVSSDSISVKKGKELDISMNKVNIKNKGDNKRRLINIMLEDNCTIIKRSRCYLEESEKDDVLLGDINIYTNSVSNNKYNIHFHSSFNGLFCLCSCGLQFGCGLRCRCKHIRFIINCLIDTYLDNSDVYSNLLTDDLEETSDMAEDIMFKFNKMSLESLDSIFCIRIDDKTSEDSFTNLSLKYNKKNKLHLSCSNTDNPLGCLTVRKGISSMVQSFTNAGNANKSEKKVRKKLQKDINDFMM